MRRVLIYGAGEAGHMVFKEIMKRPEEQMEVLGFLDDDQGKWGERIEGIPVMGGRDELQRLIDKMDINEVVISMPSIQKALIKEIVALCKAKRVSLLIVPSTQEIIEGRVHFDQIKQLDLADLLEREPIPYYPEKIEDYISGHRVLVTGAAGSIGSALVKKLVEFQPACIYTLDINENGLFYLLQEEKIEARHDDIQLIPFIVDIKDRQSLADLFIKYEPQVVFHAAAYKHVPLMERHARMAFFNNVVGTLNLLEASHRFGIERFVGISTDKAVYPFSVMGKTKRVSELLISAFAQKGVSCCSVRFGNVLGSNGSVLTVFREQIRRGGPVTITSPEMERYFMTIEEAVSLLLQAGSIGKDGHVYVLDMGKPIKIRELAENLIFLSGMIPEVDINIKYTGIREGEKLTEKLFYDEAHVVPSLYRGIYIEESDINDNGIIATIREIAEQLYDLSKSELIEILDLLTSAPVKISTQSCKIL